MASQASPKAGRRKVRCPKCTALFSEPAKAVFECPICSCRLSANGVIASTESSSHQTGEDDFAHRKAVIGKGETIKMQSPIDFVEEEGISSNGNYMSQEEKSIDCEQNSGAFHTQTYSKREQQPTTDSPQVFENGEPSVSKPGHLVNGEDIGELPLQLLVVMNEEASSAGTTGQDSLDGLKEKSLMLRDKSNLIAAEDEGIERQESAINGVPSNRHLQSQILRTTRCEFSFKYSLGGAAPLKSDGDLFHRKRSPNAKIVSSAATLPNAEASDMPLHTPLRVRISKSPEESSDQSEHGRKSFGSETDSDGTSGSDFDFPAPWADGLQDVVLPAPFSQNEVFHPNSGAFVSTAPHQLELLDVYDTIDHEEITLQQESRRHLKVSDVELSSQVENAGKTIRMESELSDEESSQGALPPVFSDEKNCVLLGSPDRAEITMSELKPRSSHTQSLGVSDSASHISSFMHPNVVGNNEVSSMEDSTQKPNGSGSEDCFDAGEEQETSLKVKFQQEKLGNIQPNFIVQQDGKQGNMISERENLESKLIIRDAVLTNSATLPYQEYLEPKQSAININLTDCNDVTHIISNTGGFQMVDLLENYKNGPFDNHQKTMPSGAIKDELSFALDNQLGASPLSSMSKIEQSNVANDRDGRTGNCYVSSHMENAQLEQDLYKLPLEIYGNDSISGESSRLALWAGDETAVSALSDSKFVHTSKEKLYHKKKSNQKSSHGKLNGYLGSRLLRSDNGENHFMSGEERSLRGQAVLQEATLQATSEHVDWEGHIAAGEDCSGHLKLHEMEVKPVSYSVNNSLSFPLANPQPLTNHHCGFGASAGTSQMYPYHMPSQSLMLPAAFQNRALSHFGYHAISPACMVCSYHQYPHLQPQHIPHCGACLSQSGSMAYNPGLVEHWNCHQAHFGPASSHAGSLVDYPQACSSTNLNQRHDSSNAESSSQASSVRKASQYPPFPKNSAAPYVTCKGCTRVLRVPSDLPLNDGVMQKLRCGACGKVAKFSVNHHEQQRGYVSSSLPPELDSLGGIVNMSPVVQGGTRTRQPPVSSGTESIKSSYKYDMSKVNPIPHGSNEVSPRANSTAAFRTSEQNPLREAFRVQPRSHAMDASYNIYGQQDDPSIAVSTTGPTHLQNVSSMVGVMSPRKTALRSTDSFAFEKSKVNPAASFHLTVDEKEEGLDFGAPRISDGDSLDHSESRMRSPDYNQAYHETNYVDISQGVPSRGHQPLEQVSDLSEDSGTDPQEKKPGSPLLVLLNQESTRFRLNLEPRAAFEGSKSAMWSPASDPSPHPNSLYNRAHKREQDSPRPHGSPGQHFVSKGPRYIAGLLRRSLRDLSRGGQ